ncbi:MAG: hypothetical protein ACLUEQ_05105 [Cloacibacillus evryensis]
MEIAKERLNREFGVDLVATAPNVVYQIVQTDGSIIEAHRPSDFPDPVRIEEIREPYIKLSICPNGSSARRCSAGTRQPTSRWIT